MLAPLSHTSGFRNCEKSTLICYTTSVWYLITGAHTDYSQPLYHDSGGKLYPTGDGYQPFNFSDKRVTGAELNSSKCTVLRRAEEGKTGFREAR